MYFTDIHLQNFRSYTDSSFEIGPNVTIVIGPNAAGKTNLLEAIMLAATGKTYRPNENLIRHGADWARIEVHTSTNSERIIKLKDGERTTEMDKKPYKRLPFSQKQPTVVFEPYDLFLLHGEPQNRRNYLDDLLEQLSPGFSKTRRDYKRTLSQRNRYLKQKAADNNVLFALNIKLSESAAMIVENRRRLTAQLSEQIPDIYNKIASTKTEVSLAYKSSIERTNYTARLLHQLEQNIELDIARGYTSAGPHRDDLECMLDREPANTTGSRGEARTLLLSLKMLELTLLEEKLGVKPLLLLDDVFSELDGARRKALVKFLKGHQTIITTTDADIVTKNFSQNCQIIPLG